VAGARANKGNLRGSDAGQAAGKFIDDFVGELVGEFTDFRIRGSATIDLADNRFRGSAANIVKPGGNDNFRRAFREVAESDEVGVEGRISPGEELEFLRLGRNLRGIEAGRDEFEDAGEGEVVADDLREKAGVGTGVRRSSGKIGYRDSGLFDAQASPGAEPVLREDGRREKEAQDDYEGG